HRRGAAGPGPADRRFGAGAFRRVAGAGAAGHRRQLVNLATPVRAALLMFLSTLLFALMVIAIRLASEQVHAFEVAFFRSLFGMLAALPLLRMHGFGLLRTTHLPRYVVRCVLGT